MRTSDSSAWPERFPRIVHLWFQGHGRSYVQTNAEGGTPQASASARCKPPCVLINQQGGSPSFRTRRFGDSPEAEASPPVPTTPSPTWTTTSAHEGTTPATFYKPEGPYSGTLLGNYPYGGRRADRPGEPTHLRPLRRQIFHTERPRASASFPTAKQQRQGPTNCGSIQFASTRHGGRPGRQDGSPCVRQLQYEKDWRDHLRGLLQASSCDIEPGSKVKITGPVGKGKCCCLR